MRNDRLDTEIPWGPRNGKQLVGRESECNLTAIGDNYWRQTENWEGQQVARGHSYSSGI